MENAAVILALIAIIVSIIGLRVSNKSNSLSNLALDVSNRPWLMVSIEHAEEFFIETKIENGKLFFSIKIKIHNTGKSPAKNIKVVDRKIESDIPGVSTYDIPDDLILGPGDDFFMILKGDMTPKPGKTPEDVFEEQFLNENLKTHVNINLKYQNTYDYSKVYETIFKREITYKNSRYVDGNIIK